MRLSKEQQQLVEDNLALVRKVISDKVRGAGGIGVFSYEDLYQTGCIGLCKAAYTDKFQYAYKRENAHSSEETRFSTYAYRLIWNEIYMVLMLATRVRAENPTDPQVVAFKVDEMGSSNHEIEDTELCASIRSMMEAAAETATGVTAKGIQALTYMAHGYTSTEIAQMMGARSGNNVTAWIAKARKHLKSNPDLVRLMTAT